MIKDIETLGLKVESIRPSTNKHDVETTTDIKIKFNADILAKTIIGNVCVYEDTDCIFNGEIDPTKLTRISGKISYESKTIIFVPKEELKPNKQYIIVVNKNGLTDIIGRTLLEDNISTFFTKSESMLPKPSIIKPINNSTLSDNLMIEFLNTSDVYNVQISKSIEFDHLIVDEVVKSSNNEIVTYTPNINLKDGLYYIRIKTSDNAFSDVVQVYYQNNVGVVSEEDYNDLLDEFEQNELELLSSFPNRDKVAGVNISNVCFKFKGEVDIDDININKSSFIGELFDETDEDSISEAGYQDTNIILVYDEDEFISYLISTIE